MLDDFHWSKQNWLAVHGRRIAYLVNSPTVPEDNVSIIQDLDSGAIRELQTRVLPTDFTRDGRTLLARRATDGALVTCVAPDYACSEVTFDGAPIAGALPRWSADEQRIFFRRAKPDRPGYADIWVVDRAGGEPRPVAEIGPYDPQSVFFGVTDDDRIVWNEYDRIGNSEIWIAER